MFTSWRLLAGGVQRRLRATRRRVLLPQADLLLCRAGEIPLLPREEAPGAKSVKGEHPKEPPGRLFCCLLFWSVIALRNYLNLLKEVGGTKLAPCIISFPSLSLFLSFSRESLREQWQIFGRTGSKASCRLKTTRSVTVPGEGMTWAVWKAKKDSLLVFPDETFSCFVLSFLRKFLRRVLYKELLSTPSAFPFPISTTLPTTCSHQASSSSTSLSRQYRQSAEIYTCCEVVATNTSLNCVLPLRPHGPKSVSTSRAGGGSKANGYVNGAMSSARSPRKK